MLHTPLSFDCVNSTCRFSEQVKANAETVSADTICLQSNPRGWDPVSLRDKNQIRSDQFLRQQLFSRFGQTHTECCLRALSVWHLDVTDFSNPQLPTVS